MKKKILATILGVTMALGLTQCGSKEGISREEAISNVSATIEEFQEVVKNNTISGSDFKEISDETSYGFEFENYVSVMSSNKPVEAGQIYYSFYLNEDRNVVDTSLNYIVNMTIRVPNFEFSNFSAVEQHLEKIKETETKLDLDEIQSIVNEALSIDDYGIIMESELDNGSFTVSIDNSNKREKVISIEYYENGSAE